MPLLLRSLALAALLLGACGGTEAPKAAPATTTSTMGEVLIDGVPAAQYNAAMAEWDATVAEWNDLTLARDAAGADMVVVDGQSFDSHEEWAAAFGKPLAFEDVLAKYRQ